MRRALASIASLALLLSMLPGKASAQVPEPKPSITTTGDAVIYVVPDEVAMTVGIETFDANLDKSTSANTAAANKFVTAMKELGVKERYIETNGLLLEPKYRDNSHPSAGIEGYFARRTYCVTLKDIKLVDKAIDVALKSGVNQIQGLDFRTTELRKHRDQARRMAAKAAKEKADLLAGELGAKVGAPRQITEGASQYGYYGRFNNNYMLQNAAQVVGNDAGEAGDAANSIGQIAVRASVSVQFDLKE